MVRSVLDNRKCNVDPRIEIFDRMAVDTWWHAYTFDSGVDDGCDGDLNDSNDWIENHTDDGDDGGDCFEADNCYNGDDYGIIDDFDDENCFQTNESVLMALNFSAYN